MSKEINSIFYGKVVEERYRFGYGSGGYMGWGAYERVILRVILDRETVCKKEFERCFLEEPQLEVGDTIYINRLGTEVKIERTVRATGNEAIYYTDYIIEVVNEEERDKSLAEARKLDEEVKLRNRIALEQQQHRQEVVGVNDANELTKWQLFKKRIRNRCTQGRD